MNNYVVCYFLIHSMHILQKLLDYNWVGKNVAKVITEEKEFYLHIVSKN